MKATGDWRRSATIAQQARRGVPTLDVSRASPPVPPVPGAEDPAQIERTRSKSRDRKLDKMQSPEREHGTAFGTPKTPKTPKSNPHEPKFSSADASGARLERRGSASWRGENTRNSAAAMHAVSSHQKKKYLTEAEIKDVAAEYLALRSQGGNKVPYAMAEIVQGEDAPGHKSEADTMASTNFRKEMVNVHTHVLASTGDAEMTADTAKIRYHKWLAAMPDSQRVSTETKVRDILPGSSRYVPNAATDLLLKKTNSASTANSVVHVTLEPGLFSNARKIDGAIPNLIRRTVEEAEVEQRTHATNRAHQLAALSGLVHVYR